MKKMICSFLALCVCFLALSACGAKPSSTPPETEASSAPQYNGLYLPDRMTVPADGTTHNVELVWTNNSCTFTAVETEFLFTFDESTRTLDCSITRDGQTTSLDDVCVFDEQGRVLSVTFNGRTVLSFSYENGKATVLSCSGADNFVPMEIPVNWETREVQMPPFDDPNDLMIFTEQGDLTSGEGTLLCTYAYDDNGNITSVTTGDSAVVLHYGTTPLTASWQKCPLKIMLPYIYGWAYAVFAMDMMCMSLHIHNVISG